MRFLLLTVAACLALAGCQSTPKFDAFFGTSNRCEQAEAAYGVFRLVAGNKSTKQVEAFMAGVRAAREAGSDCTSINLAQLAQAIAAGKAALGVD